MSKISDQGLANLASFTALWRLDISHTRVTDAGLGTLLSLPDLQTLFVGPGVGEKGMAIIAKIPKLDTLYVSVTGDDALVPLREMPGLSRLDLSGSQITGDGLVYLLHCSKLEFLSLSKTRIADGSLPYLFKLKQLKELLIVDTELSSEGCEKLRLALPDTHVRTSWGEPL
jgi:Leucine-rich repeat (LRR) protein